MSESVFTHGEGKKRIMWAIGGLLLALLSYVILQVINPELLKVGFNLPGLTLKGAAYTDRAVAVEFTGVGELVRNIVQCEEDEMVPGAWTYSSTQLGPPPVTTHYCYSANAPGYTKCIADWSFDIAAAAAGVNIGNITDCVQIGTPNETEEKVRARLREGNLDFNEAPCDPYDGRYQDVGPCTNVGGLNETTITKLLLLKTSCGASCVVMITGGTENGHSPNGDHPKGLGVDLAHDAKLDSYIRSTGNDCGTSSNNQRPVYQINGVSYWDEDNAHFHAYFGGNKCTF